MEILGLSHPATSKSAAIMQRMIELARPSQTGETTRQGSTEIAAAQGGGVPELAVGVSVPPANATSESLLEARKPVEAVERPSAGSEAEESAPESVTYDFPEELPMNFLEMIDMLRADPAASGESLSVVGPADAAEAQRLNRTA